MLAIFLHLLHGTPYIYQGEEIGMTNVAFRSIDHYRDIETRSMYREFVEERGMDPEVVMAMIHAKSRDNARTPIQWDAGPNAGFTTGTPWIKVNPNYLDVNVENALADPDSIFYTYERLTKLRQEHPVIVYGSYDLLLGSAPRRARTGLRIYPHAGGRAAPRHFELYERRARLRASRRDSARASRAAH